MILDTSFIIDVMNGEEEALEKLKKVEESSEKVSVTAVTIHELYSGLSSSDRPEEEREKIMNVVQSKNIAELDEDSAIKSGRAEGRFEGSEKIPPQDCMIAGIASQNSEKILTNDSDFESLARELDIGVENY